MNRLSRLALKLCLVLPLVGQADTLRLNDRLPPDEQYRRLSLILLIGDSAGVELADALPAPQPVSGAVTDVDPDRLKSPLIRIVDQESMLTGAAWMFRLARLYGAEIGARMQELASDHPEAIRAVSVAGVREDALLVRNAVADAIEYAGLPASPALTEGLAAYRARTLELRNLMEYEQFDHELQRITEEAIAAVGGKLDAYQRMFDDEVQDKAFEQHIRAAEHPYAGRRPFDEDAGKVAEEVMQSVVLAESLPDN